MFHRCDWSFKVILDSLLHLNSNSNVTVFFRILMASLEKLLFPVQFGPVCTICFPSVFLITTQLFYYLSTCADCKPVPDPDPGGRQLLPGRAPERTRGSLGGGVKIST